LVPAQPVFVPRERTPRGRAPRGGAGGGGGAPPRPADLLREFLGAGLVDVGERHRRAAGRKLPGARRADTARTAGDQRGATVEVGHATPALARSSRSAWSSVTGGVSSRTLIAHSCLRCDGARRSL